MFPFSLAFRALRAFRAFLAFILARFMAFILFRLTSATNVKIPMNRLGAMVIFWSTILLFSTLDILYALILPGAVRIFSKSLWACGEGNDPLPMDYRSEHAPYSEEWAAERGMEPGFGGVWPGSPDAKKYKVTVRSRKTNETFVTNVANDRYIYYAFEEERKQLPIVNSHKMCRQGCCTICAAKIVDGKVKMDAPLGLLKELRNQNYGLLCCAMPRSDIVVELQDEDEMYVRQWSEGFEGGGGEWGGVFIDED